MSFVMAMAPFYGCGQVFSFNPRLVPSVNGEPLCRTCMTRINGYRTEQGLPPIRTVAEAYAPLELDD